MAPDRRHIRSVPGLEALTATGSAPSPQIREYIKQLCSAGVTVVILSGRNRAFLEEWFGGMLFCLMATSVLLHTHTHTQPNTGVSCISVFCLTICDA